MGRVDETDLDEVSTPCLHHFAVLIRIVVEPSLNVDRREALLDRLGRRLGPPLHAQPHLSGGQDQQGFEVIRPMNSEQAWMVGYQGFTTGVRLIAVSTRSSDFSHSPM